jgi:hypothetical protein
MGHGNDDHQGDEEPGPLASSTRRCDGAGRRCRRSSLPASRSVVSVLLRKLGAFVMAVLLTEQQTVGRTLCRYRDYGCMEAYDHAVRCSAGDLRLLLGQLEVGRSEARRCDRSAT